MYSEGRVNPLNSSRRDNNQDKNQSSNQKWRQNKLEHKRYDKSQGQCHYCKIFIHYVNECRMKQYDLSKQNANFIIEEK